MSKRRPAAGVFEPLARAIEQREAELRREIAEERERAYVEGFAEMRNASGDTVDRAFAHASAGIEYQRIESHLAEIRDLAAARKRMETGEFGICVDCGEAIDPTRLAAFPAAARCTICQDRYERARAIHQ
jgi:RNA polymerase-binding transcription factor DksA